MSINSTRIEHLVEPDARRAVYIDTAELKERELADTDGAFGAYASAAREGARTSELDALERLAGALDRWADTAELFAELWDEAIDPGLRTEVGLRTARIREEQLGDTDAAVEALVRVNEDAPQNQAALDGLDRLYTQQGAWEALAEILRQKVALGGAANDKGTLLLRQGELQAGQLEDPAAAVQTYREVLAETPAHPDAVAALERLAEQGEELFDVAAILDPLYRERYSGRSWGASSRRASVTRTAATSFHSGSRSRTSARRRWSSRSPRWTRSRRRSVSGLRRWRCSTAWARSARRRVTSLTSLGCSDACLSRSLKRRRRSPSRCDARRCCKSVSATTRAQRPRTASR